MPLVRISVANLADRLVCSETGEVRYFGVKPKNRIQALGGGAQLTAIGVYYLTEKFRACHFELDEHTGGHDARFQVPEEHVEGALRFFEGHTSTTGTKYEKDPTSDIYDELTGTEWPNLERILTPMDAGKVMIRYRTMGRQPLPLSGHGTSERESAGLPNRRLFRRFDLVTTPALFAKVLSADVVRALSVEELATTYGGTTKGKARDGTELADNLFV